MRSHAFTAVLLVCYFSMAMPITKCQKLISPLLSVRHSLSLQATAIPQNDKTNKSGSHSLDNNPRVLAGQALHPKYKCIL